MKIAYPSSSGASRIARCALPPCLGLLLAAIPLCSQSTGASTRSFGRYVWTAPRSEERRVGKEC